MKPAMPRCLTLTAALLLSPLPGMADSFVIDPRHTFPSFEISHLGFSMQRGRFDQTSGTLQLDTQKKTGAIHVEIAANSIDTGLPELEEHLKKEDFFNVAKYPKITYDADRLVFEGDRPVRAEGKLTLLGVTQPLSLTIDHFQCGINPLKLKYACGANATGSLKRSAFGMSALLPAVGDEVKIAIQVEAFRE
jgi:polyisoprenoid-binding protein YceI